MPDICMCHGGDCPLKETCFRYRCHPTQHWQSYFAHPPFKEGMCAYFSQLSGGDPIRSIEECKKSEERFKKAALPEDSAGA